MYDIAIIGAGVIGSAIARELSRYDLRIVILDKENDASAGASKANSAIIHAGFDPAENTLMAKMNALGNPMFGRICEELSVPFRRNGSLVIAFDDEQLDLIEQLRQRGIRNGVPGLSVLSKEKLLEIEPAVNPEARGALFAKTGGVIDPMLLTISLFENAVMNGAEYFFNFEAMSIIRENDHYQISSGQSTVRSKAVINAAGVFSEKIHDMAALPRFRINPRRGQYFVLDKSEAGIVNATVFPCPTKIGKGILVSPTIHGNVTLGPASDEPQDKEDTGTTAESLENARAGARRLVPGIAARNYIRTYAGIRAESDSDDFIIGEADGAPGFIDVAGIKSPGLTAAPAIAVYVADLLKEKGLLPRKKDSFDPIIKRKLFIDMTEQEQSALIQSDPRYGRIICRCENITEGDILDAIRRNPGASTMNGVKRRCRAGSGRCQSGFCGTKVLAILARELGKRPEEIVLEKEGSYILTGKTK